MVDRLYSDAEIAELYDTFSAGRPDFAFYLPLVMAAPSVLDVGCGTGELLRSARAAGHSGRLTGLDPAAGMLSVARREPEVEWIEGTLGTVAFRQEFDLMVMTGHAFQVLLTDDELRTFFVAVREALTETGRFAFETRNPLVRTWERWTPDRPSVITDADGTVVTSTHDVEPPDGELVSFTTTYVSDRWPEPQMSRSTLRFLPAEALAGFLDETGLAIDEQYGEWDRSPLTTTSPEIITLARRA